MQGRCALQWGVAVRSTVGLSPRSGAFFSHLFPSKRQLWIWPHLFSFDAPFVAVLWQVLLVRDLRIPLSRGEPFVLALCVWCVYLGDRVLDALRPRTAGWEPTRKTFYRKHLRSASIAVLCLLGAVLPLAYCLLQRSTFYAGLLLAVPLLSYLTFVHLAPVRWRARWPREMVVACVFTLGVFLAIWIGNGRNIYSLWAPALLFAFLCWANCCAIETWEWQENIPYLEGEPSGSTCWAARHLPLLALSIACSAGLAGRMALAPPDFSVAAFLSGVTLFALALCRSRLSMDGLRVAADLALCTPVLVFFLSFL